MSFPKIYLVGGANRDFFLGLNEKKDLDYTVVCGSFEEMRQAIIDRGGKIFVEKQQYLTIRAKVPGLGSTDFVLARKDGVYEDGRHPNSVEIASLFEDLSRRDFCVNAIAKDVDTGEYIDPFNGILDCQNKILRCVGSAEKRFKEDFLRLLRACRFNITKGLSFHEDIKKCLNDPEIVSGLSNISPERIREELFKMFAFDTLKAIELLNEYQLIRDMVLKREKFRIWLKPTSEER